MRMVAPPGAHAVAHLDQTYLVEGGFIDVPNELRPFLLAEGYTDSPPEETPADPETSPEIETDESGVDPGNADRAALIALLRERGVEITGRERTETLRERARAL